jgi:NADH-quinone oxidoreductase subunit A
MLAEYTGVLVILAIGLVVVGAMLGVQLLVGFDVEAIFFYPWAATFMELSWFGFAGIAVFTVPLAVGLVYEWMKGGLDW